MSDLLTKDDLVVPDRKTPLVFVPPPRFGRTSFESYRPQHPSQGEARDEVREFAIGVKDEAPAPGFRWPWSRPPRPAAGRGLYLDGGFGVGKTHLLAAAYHEAAVQAKAYVSFQELVYLIGATGMPAAKERLGDCRLLCIDEFELDDPGNTLIVKTFLQHAFDAGASVVTTSNTPPDAQGQGRFNAEDFRREIQSIAERFRTIPVGGPDFRRRESLATLLSDEELTHRSQTEAAQAPKALLEWDDLIALLGRMHPIRYADVLERLGTVYVRGMRQLLTQNDALRFVHFIDKLYDRKVQFRGSGEVPLEELFDPSYRRGAYAKKHYRCLSRLSELLEEPPRGS